MKRFFLSVLLLAVIIGIGHLINHITDTNIGIPHSNSEINTVSAIETQQKHIPQQQADTLSIDSIQQ